MVTGVWEPGKKTVTVAAVDMRLVSGILERIRERDLDDLAALLGEELLNQGASLMQLQAESWEPVKALSIADLGVLIRFFTLAEMQFAGWQAGSKSPVISLVKVLRDRGEFTSDLRKWIKAHTDNRYLPYGSVF